MTSQQFRLVIGKFIVGSTIAILFSIFLSYVISGLSTDEFFTTLKFLIPIKSIYIVATIRYIISYKEITLESETSKPLNDVYTKTVYIILYGYISLIFIAVLLITINRISFDGFMNFLAFNETFFGACVGIILTDLFKPLIK